MGVFYKKKIDVLKTLSEMKVCEPLVMSENDIKLSALRQCYSRYRDSGKLEGVFSFNSMGNGKYIVTRVS
ncbi:MAG: hypothetical protein NC083_09030 [Muribaculum sp.]|nr:hypothetical protein [Muribaculum sp.]MCM1577089.1 hypothetical protein [Bacteroides sp.]